MDPLGVFLYESILFRAPANSDINLQIVYILLNKKQM